MLSCGFCVELWSGFMSAGFDLALIGAPLIAAAVALCCMLLCSFRQRLNLVFPSVSMRLMPRRSFSFSFSQISLKSIILLLNLRWGFMWVFAGLVLEWSVLTIFT